MKSLRWLWEHPLYLVWSAPLLWATNITMGRAVAHTFPPVALTWLRWFVAIAVLLPFIWPRVRAQAPLLRQYWKFLFLTGALGMAGYSALAYIALRTTTAANVAFINSTVPLLVPLFMLFLLREPMSRRAYIGITVSFCGVGWIIAKGEFTNLAHLSFTRGDLITLLAVAMYALYSVLIRKKPRELDLLVFLFGGMLGAIVALFPFVVLEFALGARVPTDPKSMLALLYIGLVVSLGSYLLWNHCIVTLGPGVAGPAYHLISVFTPIVAYLFLDESLAGYHYAGIALILAGVFITTRPVRAPART
ncbi:MAG TPA: DMT family transporter [Burkholderiales bacterium]|jgi:drug/metabolite transporter (DMT)-like permease